MAYCEPMGTPSRLRRITSLLAITTGALTLACSSTAPRATSTAASTSTASASASASPSASTATSSPTDARTPTASATGSATAGATSTTTGTNTPGAAATAVRTAAPAASAAPPPAVTSGRAVEIERGTPSRREVAFTFDCAASSGPTAEILDVLREEGVRTTWFMVGVWVEQHQELTKRIAREHELANHSYWHPDYRDLTDAQIADDMEQLDRQLIALTGKGTKPLWRAPSGARDQRVLEAAARAGWPLHIFWTIGRDANGSTVTGDTGDWRDIPAAEVMANTVKAAGLGPGVIIVSHCDKPSTAAVMRETIQLFRREGLRIVTVSEMLRP